MKFSSIIILLLLYANCVFSLTNENSLTAIERSWDLGIGLGYGNSSNPFIGAEDVPTFLALDFSVYGKRFFLDNGEIGFTLVDTNNSGINIIATYNNERVYYSLLNQIGITIIRNDASINSIEPPSLVSIDNNTHITPRPVIPRPNPGDPVPSPTPPPPLLSSLLPFGENILLFDIPNKKSSLNIGFEIIHDFKWGSVNFQTTSDVIGVHSGYESTLDISKSWKNNNWGFLIHAGVQWKSKNLVNYYYGVDYEFDPIVGIKYEPNASLDSSIGFSTSYRLSNNLSFITTLNYTRYGRSIANSPLIDESSSHSIFSGLFYRF